MALPTIPGEIRNGLQASFRRGSKSKVGFFEQQIATAIFAFRFTGSDYSAYLEK